MCSTEEDNAAQLRIFSSGKSHHQYGQVTLSIWLRIFSTDFSTAWDMQYAPKSNLSTDESHYQYNWRYAVWVRKIIRLLEMRGTTERYSQRNDILSVTSIKTTRSLQWGVRIS